MKNFKPPRRKPIQRVPVYVNNQGDEEVEDTLNEFEQMESVTSTGCIAMPPVPFKKKRRGRNNVKNLREDCNLGSDDMENLGGAWPRKLKNGKATTTNSKPGTASDGITSEIGSNNLRRRLKNAGGSQEEFANSKPGAASDGITSEIGSNDLKYKLKNAGGMHEPVGSGSMEESTELTIQSLFEAYVRDQHVLNHRQFNQLCEIYRLGPISRDVFESMLDAHQCGFMLGEDDNWFKQNIIGDDSDLSDDEAMDDEEAMDEDEALDDEALDEEEAMDEDCSLNCEDFNMIGETHTHGMVGNPTADKNGILGGDATQPIKSPNPKGKSAVSSTLKQSKSGKPEDGITTKARSSDLGDNSAMVNKVEMQENINLLCKNAKKFLIEAAKALPKDKYKVEFTVRLGNICESTTNVLVSAMADAEELMQASDDEQPSVEAKFINQSGGVALVKQVPLVTITPRGAFTDGTQAMFRFKPVAEAFSRTLAESGITSRVQECNWGYAVKGNIPSKLIREAFEDDPGQKMPALPPEGGEDEYKEIFKRAIRQQLEDNTPRSWNSDIEFDPPTEFEAFTISIDVTDGIGPFWEEHQRFEGCLPRDGNICYLATLDDLQQRGGRLIATYTVEQY